MGNCRLRSQNNGLFSCFGKDSKLFSNHLNFEKCETLTPLEEIKLVVLPISSNQENHSVEETQRQTYDEAASDFELDLSSVDSVLGIFSRRSNLVFEGLVLASSPFKVVETKPRCMFGRYVDKRTHVLVQYPVCAGLQPIGFLEKIVLVLVQGGQFGTSSRSGSLSVSNVSKEECFGMFKLITTRVRLAGARLHAYEGQKIETSFENEWLIATKCKPASGGFVGPDTEVHFFTPGERLCTVRSLNLRIIPSVQSAYVVSHSHFRESLEDDVRSFFATNIPIYVGEGSGFCIPFARTHQKMSDIEQMVNQREQEETYKKTSTSVDSLRKMRLAYFERELQRNTKSFPVESVMVDPKEQSDHVNNESLALSEFFSVVEVCMIEWNATEVSLPGNSTGGFIIGNTTINFDFETQVQASLRTSLEVPPHQPGYDSFVSNALSESSEQALVLDVAARPYQTEYSVDRCMRCNAMICLLPSAFDGTSSFRSICLMPILYSCPCGQPLANSHHPFWFSVMRMGQSPESAAHPSVIFLNGLREAISVMPLSDMRSSFLHQALDIFPCDEFGNVDFDMADILVLMIMPSLQLPLGVDDLVLSALPLSSFADLKEDAIRRGETCCPICMDDYVETDQLRTLPCWHFYHSDCIGIWLKAHVTCPVCKFEVS